MTTKKPMASGKGTSNTLDAEQPKERWTEIDRQACEALTSRQMLDRVVEENAALHSTLARLQAEKRSAQAGLKQMAADANKILKDKWWRRTKSLRSVSNSVRALQGKPKKRWPKQFVAERYLRASPPSPKKPESRETPFVPGFSARTSVRLTVVAMARNEAARAHDCMRHFCALFDRVIVIDHKSTDTTAQIVSSYRGINGADVILFRGEDEGYFQSEYMSAVANALIREGKSDWIFFVDFDEYLPYENKDELRQVLSDAANREVVHGHWLNLALKNFQPDSLQGADALIGPVVSQFVKIAINARRIRPGRVTVEQGNHAVILPGDEKASIGERLFALYHVPFTNVEMLRRKVAQGAQAMKAMQPVDDQIGTHWLELERAIAELTASSDLAREVAINYGLPLEQIRKAVGERATTPDMRSIKIAFAQTEHVIVKPEYAPPKSFTLDKIDAFMSANFPSAPAHEPLYNWGNAIFEQLPDRKLPAAELGSGRDRVEHALLAAATDVEVVVPTSWLGHIPFLFSLMETLRPRRYVELGTHAGASFFAACQHIRSNGSYGEAVALDLWTGDHQSGFYSESVFDNFKLLLNRHFPMTGKFVRGYFKDAAPSFGNKSIDLLHIDGLHTYQAVKEDYETWRPKLTDNGVIIFHDTNEYQTDFGVWHYFAEIRGEAEASFQFRHGHGLGVMAFGSAELNPAIELLQHFNTRPEKIESYFAVISKALFQASRSKFA
jgi:hypothetical protein